MATDEKVLDILQKVGAFRSGHFVFTSGLHSKTYILKDAMYAHTKETSDVCREMAERFRDANVEAVIGPAIGAAILAQWVAFHLSDMMGKEVYAVYADKNGEGGFIIKRGYDEVIKGKNTLIVEDLTTTGGSIKKVVDAVRAVGANVVGAIAICNRGGVTKEAVGNPPIFTSLLDVEMEQWPEAECELCQRGIPVNIDVGHGKEFLARKKASN
ncbi:MAG: phosphoribosyltransferase family protein [bacterium]|nr:phosphoribosyltransferase family protein [bacterium]